MEISQGRSYRWVILFLTVFGNAILNFSNLIFSARAVDVMRQFHMSQAQLASVSTISLLPGAFLSIMLGITVDKMGAKKVTAICYAIGALIMIWRVAATSYMQLLITTLLAGVFLLPVNVVGPKIIGAWFPRKEMGTAIGLFGAAAGMGTSAAFGIGNLFPSTKVAFAYIAGGFVLLFLLWVILAKDIKTSMVVPSEEGSSPGSLRGVLKSRNVWLTVLITGFAVGVSLLVNIYLTQALVLAKGLPVINAGLITTLMNVCLVIGGVISGFVVSKTGRINITYAFICIGGAILYLLVWFLPFGTHTYILIAFAGLVVAGSIGVNMTRIPLLPLICDFGPESVATVSGLNNTILGISAFLIPTVIAAVAGTNFNLVFIIIASILVLMTLLSFFIPELGQSQKSATVAKRTEMA